MTVQNTATEKYLDTLLLYFEEEIIGEGYFLGLAKRFLDPDQREKMTYLAKVERCAAERVRPLLHKYGLKPRLDIELFECAKEDIEQSFSLGWNGLIDHMVESYPNYMPEFQALEAMAPSEDIADLKRLSAHEVAAIEFAKLEQAGSKGSLIPLQNYIASR